MRHGKVIAPEVEGGFLVKEENVHGDRGKVKCRMEQNNGRRPQRGEEVDFEAEDPKLGRTATSWQFAQQQAS